MDSKIFREAALAYQAVYDEELRQEIEEQQDFENWVNSLVEEGYDLSEYTWEEMYEAYLDEGPIEDIWKNRGRIASTVSRVGSAVNRASSDTLNQLGTSATNTLRTARNIATSRPVQGAVSGFNRNGLVGAVAGAVGSRPGGGSRPAPAANRPAGGSGSANRPTGGSGSANRPTGGSGSANRPTGGSGSANRPTGGSGSAPAANRPAASAPTAKPSPTPSAPAPAKPTPAPSTPAAKPSAMDQWAKANPKLAAAKAERDRTRGTSSTTNPQMADLKSKLPTAKTSSSATPAPKPTPSTPTASTPKPIPTSSTATPAAKPTPTPVKRPGGSVKPGSIVSGFDLFDVVKGYLIDEGFAETEHAAIAIMANMSEEWKLEIIDEAVKGESSDRRRALAAERRKGIKPLSAKEGEKYASHKISQMAYTKRAKMGDDD